MKTLLMAVLTLFASNTILAGEKEKTELEPGLYVEFTTARGVILCVLEYQKTPMTVGNFVGLAEGNLHIIDTLNYDKPFYNGLMTFVTSDVVTGLELVSENAVERWRQTIGPTRTSQAKQ